MPKQSRIGAGRDRVIASESRYAAPRRWAGRESALRSMHHWFELAVDGQRQMRSSPARAASEKPH